MANFAETEQIIMLGSEPAAVSGAGRGSGSGTEKGRALASGVSSFVCLRGSIPLFWKQELSDWTQIKPKLSLASNLPIEAQDPPPSPVCPEKSPSQQGGGEGGGSAAAQHTECAGGNAASPVSSVSNACCTTLQSFFIHLPIHPSTHPAPRPPPLHVNPAAAHTYVHYAARALVSAWRARCSACVQFPDARSRDSGSREGGAGHCSSARCSRGRRGEGGCRWPSRGRRDARGHGGRTDAGGV